MGGTRDRELRQLQKDKEKAQRKGDLKEEADICNQLGSVLARCGRFQEALEEHRQELRLLESLNDDLGCAVAHRKIGECLAELESYKAALKHQRRHLELACSLSSPIEQQRAWATIGRTYMFMADTDQSSEALQEAEKAFMKSLAILEDVLEGEIPEREASEMRARLYLNLGLVYEGLKNPAKCTYYIKKSIYISEQTHLYEDLYRAYFNLGNMHQRQGEHSKAMRCLERARECACKMKEKYMESECCASLAQVLLSLGDFAAAKRALKKAYLLGSQRPEQRESICHSLRYATKGSHLQQALEEAEAAGDLQASLGLCEQLGDLFSKAGDFQRSVQAYKKQLHLAQSLKRPDQELAVIHVSLATTFGDLKDHAQAVRHYQAELALRQGNLLEEGKTWLNIALSKEEAKESSEEVKQSFQTALRNAEKACDPKLQCQILRHFHAFQRRKGCLEEASTWARLQELCRSQGWRSDGEVSEDDTEEDSEPLDVSDLELSDSDVEDDLEGYDKTVPGQRRIRKWNQRNDKGETLLHRACIDGNLRRVQVLVEKGHPVNSRDYCGWTPLHEACNHGHLEIVHYLLDHGAAIDDAGGSGCEGITPLHDALNCGHFDVAELLIQRGASVLLCNAKGQSPLDTLKAWMNLYGRDLDQETRERCRAMEHLLKKASAGRGLQSVLSCEQPASQLFDAELPVSPASCPVAPATEGLSPQRSQWEPGEGSRPPPGPVKKRQRLIGHNPRMEEWSASLEPAGHRVPGLTAPAEYQAAIRGVGSAQFRPPRSPERVNLPSGPALIPPEEYVGDDWLEDDLGRQPSSCKRNRCQSPAEDSGRSTESDAEDRHQPPTGVARKRRRVRQSRLTEVLRRTQRASAKEGLKSPVESSGMNLGPNINGQIDDVAVGAGETLPAGPTLLPVPPPPLRVRVRVQDNVFLIPVPHSGGESRPVSWLAEQASQRYYQTCGLLPRLTLKKEGALLAPQDCIMDVLQSNEEVLAEVQSWDLPPLVERYRKACRSLAVGEHRLLLKMLERQESGSSFSVAGVTLRRLHLSPLLRALKLQTSIRHLCLSKGGLSNDSAEELLASLSTMPNLKSLDLSHNSLGPQGLSRLAGEPSGSVIFQNLEDLDLSLNPLGDSSVRPLAALVQACPVLSSLSLQACSFTTAFLQHHRLPLAAALAGTEHLKRMNISHNAMGPSGLALLLQSLHCQMLTHLDISAVVARPGDRTPLQDPVVSYLAQEGCALTHLAFSGNQLGDGAVADLARCLPLCLSLLSLDLSANPEISIVGLRTLLLALEGRSPLDFLGLAGCSIKGPLDSVAWAKLSSSVSQLKLCSRQVSSSDQRDLLHLWLQPEGASLHSVTRHHKLFCHCERNHCA